MKKLFLLKQSSFMENNTGKFQSMSRLKHMSNAASMLEDSSINWGEKASSNALNRVCQKYQRRHKISCKKLKMDHQKSVPRLNQNKKRQRDHLENVRSKHKRSKLRRFKSAKNGPLMTKVFLSKRQSFSEKTIHKFQNMWRLNHPKLIQ